MASNGDFSDEGSQPGSPLLDAHNARGEVEDQEPLEQEEKPRKSAMKKATPAPQPTRPELPEQPNPDTLDLSTLTPLSPEIIARQATQNIGMCLVFLGELLHPESAKSLGFHFSWQSIY